MTKNSLDSFIKTFEKEYKLLKNELVGGKTENNNKEDYITIFHKAIQLPKMLEKYKGFNFDR